jgi:hypothetical protein
MTDIRPPFSPAMSRAAFDTWYWSKAELENICALLKRPRYGSKAELRERVALHLENPDAPSPRRRMPRDSTFDWKSATLTQDTLITEGISFGPNVRGFFKSVIGSQFTCTGEFMDWVKNNPGATLGDAVEIWRALDGRKTDPAFRREIAEHNNFLQYLRDFQDHFDTLTLDDAKVCWQAKKLRPARNGMVVFDPLDQHFLHADAPPDSRD